MHYIRGATTVTQICVTSPASGKHSTTPGHMVGQNCFESDLVHVLLPYLKQNKNTVGKRYSCVPSPCITYPHQITHSHLYYTMIKKS